MAKRNDPEQLGFDQMTQAMGQGAALDTAETEPQPPQKQEKTFEQSMDRLEAIIAALERGDAPLSDAMALFEEGASLLRTCTEQLDRAEQTIVTVQKGASGGLEETPFQPEPAGSDRAGDGAGNEEMGNRA